MPSSGPGACITGQGGVGPSGDPGASESSSSGGHPVRSGAGASGAVAGGSASGLYQSFGGPGAEYKWWPHNYIIKYK